RDQSWHCGDHGFDLQMGLGPESGSVRDRVTVFRRWATTPSASVTVTTRLRETCAPLARFGTFQVIVADILLVPDTGDALSDVHDAANGGRRSLANAV